MTEPDWARLQRALLDFHVIFIAAQLKEKYSSLAPFEGGGSVPALVGRLVSAGVSAEEIRDALERAELRGVANQAGLPTAVGVASTPTSAGSASTATSTAASTAASTTASASVTAPIDLCSKTRPYFEQNPIVMEVFAAMNKMHPHPPTMEIDDFMAKMERIQPAQIYKTMISINAKAFTVDQTDGQTLAQKWGLTCPW